MAYLILLSIIAYGVKMHDLLHISRLGLKKNLGVYVVKKAFNFGRKY